MKSTVLFLTVLGCVLAIPNGYYHQEYNYKTSSSAYKNNELQHKTDDQGYYKKDGDLEGRVRPKVDANSEHSEYVNPNSRNSNYNAGLVGGVDGDMSSYGHMRANNGYNAYGANNMAAEGVATSDHLAGSRYNDYSAGSSYGNSYGSSQSYSTSSNLNSITSQLQQQLERDLQDSFRTGEYSHSTQLSINDLERELRQKISERLNAALVNKYGQQSIRGGQSYTITGGRLQSTANYDNQELSDLRSRLESSLLNQLRQQFNYKYGTQSSYGSSSAHSASSGYNYGYTSTVAPAVYYPEYTTTPKTYIVRQNPSDYTHYAPSRVHYTPYQNPESITHIASAVQNKLDTQLNDLLDQTQRRYFSSSSSYGLTNTDVVLERLRDEIKGNLTLLLDEDVRRNYGNQIQKDGRMYTLGPNGEYPTDSNYAVRDLENLKQQIERNLIEKLNRDFEMYRSRWSQQYNQQSHQSGSSQYNYGRDTNSQYTHGNVYTTPRYAYVTPVYDNGLEPYSTRPSSSHLVPLITKGGHQSNSNYNYLAGNQQSGYEVSGASGSSIAQLQRRLQQDLSRQLQSAISSGRYGSTYSTSSYPQSYQQLSDELNRNLTKQLSEYSASGSYAAYGDFDAAQMASIRNQLQSDLTKQLQQGLQQSFSASSSYSSSSSSSSDNHFRPTRNYQNNQQGQYRSGVVQTHEGEDCLGDDPNAYHVGHRSKRSYQPYRSQPLGVGYNYNSGYGSYRPSTSYGQQTDRQRAQEAEELGQQEEESDLTQQVESEEFGKLQVGAQGQQQVELGQQEDDTDLTQKVENQGFLTQQVESENFGKLQVGAQGQQQVELGQQEDDTDLTQQVEENSFGKLEVASQINQQVVPGQQEDNSDLTQQTEDSGFGGLSVGSQHSQHPQAVDDLTRQEQDNGFQQKITLNGQKLNQQQSKILTRLENDFSTLLHQAVSDHKQKNFHSSSSAASSNQIGYQELLNELQRNLTKQFEQHDSKYSYEITNNFDSEELAALKKKLSADLTNQLQNNLKQTYSHSYSWSSYGPQTNQNQQFHSQVSGYSNGGISSQGFIGVNEQQEVNRGISLGNTNGFQQPEADTAGKLEFGQQQITNDHDQSDLTQQVENINFGDQQSLPNGKLRGDQKSVGIDTVEQVVNTHRTEDSFMKLTPIPSESSSNSRPLKPIQPNSQSFLETEIQQQHQLQANHQTDYVSNPNLSRPAIPSSSTPSDEDLTQQEVEQVVDEDFLNQKQTNFNQQEKVDQQQTGFIGQPDNLPALNQVVREQRFSTEAPSKIEPLNIGNDFKNSEQSDLNGQSNIDQWPALNQVSTTLKPNGQPISVTNQGQIATQQESLATAESEADLLIQKLREAQRNRPVQPTSQPKPSLGYEPYRPFSYSHVANHGYSGNHQLNIGVSSSSQVSTGSQHQSGKFFSIGLNTEQCQLAENLESELLNRLKITVRDYKQALLTDSTIRRRITSSLESDIYIKIREILNAKYSYTTIYNSLSARQKQKLIDQLTSDLKTQLPLILEETTSNPENPKVTGYPNGGYSFPSSINYGQQQEAQHNFDTTSHIQPVQPQQAHVVQNVEGPSKYVPGVKGGRRRINTPPQLPVAQYTAAYGPFQPKPTSLIGTSPQQTSTHVGHYHGLETQQQERFEIPPPPPKQSVQTLPEQSADYGLDTQQQEQFEIPPPPPPKQQSVYGNYNHQPLPEQSLTNYDQDTQQREQFELPPPPPPPKQQSVYANYNHQPLPKQSLTNYDQNSQQQERVVVGTPSQPPQPQQPPTHHSTAQVDLSGGALQEGKPSETELVENVTEEALPWWKRVGQKIKQGAQNIKEQIG